MYFDNNFSISIQELNPLLPSVKYKGSPVKNFDFNLRSIIKKVSYGRHDYESVDDKSISLAMSRKTKKKRIRAVEG